MTVNAYATRAGKKYESDLTTFIRDRGFDVERLRLTGAEDEGDLLIRAPFTRVVIEAKRCKKMDLSGWIKEAETERLNYAEHRKIAGHSTAFPHFAVVHYARGKGLGGSYVTTTLDDWLSRGPL